MSSSYAPRTPFPCSYDEHLEPLSSLIGPGLARDMAYKTRDISLITASASTSLYYGYERTDANSCRLVEIPHRVRIPLFAPGSSLPSCRQLSKRFHRTLELYNLHVSSTYAFRSICWSSDLSFSVLILPGSHRGHREERMSDRPLLNNAGRTGRTRSRHKAQV